MNTESFSSSEAERSRPVRLHPCHSHHRHRGHGVVPGLIVVAWGVLLLMRELGMLNPVLRAWDFWPLLLIGFGLSVLVHTRTLGGALFGLVVGLLGAGILAETLGFIAGVAHFWPIVIVALGISILWRGLTHRGQHYSLANESVSTHELRRSVTMGGLQAVVDSPEFNGGALKATMGGMEIDLRRAGMAQDEVTLEVSLVMSSVELRVPGHWKVTSEIVPFMGAVEDKTQPVPDGTGVMKHLLLRGSITMGAVTIRN